MILVIIILQYLKQEEYEGHGVEKVGVASALIDPQVPHDGAHDVEVHESEADEDAPFVLCGQTNEEMYVC